MTVRIYVKVRKKPSVRLKEKLAAAEKRRKKNQIKFKRGRRI